VVATPSVGAPPGRRQGRPVEDHALAGEYLGLPVERQVPGELRRHHVGDERGRSHAAIHHARQSPGLDDSPFAVPATVLGPDGPQYAQDGGITSNASGPDRKGSKLQVVQ